MTTLNPYLTFKGNCEEAFNFYKSVFGGEFQFIGRYGDAPETDRQNFAFESDEKIMRISLPISAQTILMGIFLMAGCVGYIIDFMGSFLFSKYDETGISTFMSIPGGLGEIGICLWLLIIGIKDKRTP